METQNSRNGIAIFLLIAFGGAWTIWGIAWLLGILKTDTTGLVVVILGALSPAIAAVIVRRWVTHEEFDDAGLKLTVRKRWPYYLVGWLLPLPIVSVIVVMATALGLQAMHSDLSPLMLITAIASALILTPIFLGEELGWRGYLQLRLFPGHPLLAAVGTGLAWGVFHYPVILVGFEGFENAYIGLLLFPVFTILLSIIFGWLRVKTGSVWSTCLAHSASNTIGGSLTSYIFFGGGAFMLTSYAGVLGWLPLGIVCVWIVLTGGLMPVRIYQQSPALS
jgi:membrane protease YdiL (CAAX protease family)